MRKPQCTVVHEDFRFKRNEESTLLSRPHPQNWRVGPAMNVRAVKLLPALAARVLPFTRRRACRPGFHGLLRFCNNAIDILKINIYANRRHNISFVRDNPSGQG